MNSTLIMHDKKQSVIMWHDNTGVNDGRRGGGDTIHSTRPPHPLPYLDRQTPAPKIAAPACPSKPRLSRYPQNLNAQIATIGAVYAGGETGEVMQILSIRGFCV